MAAGLGTRLRPLTERYAKAVLPIDGRPVVAALLRELAAAGCPRVTVVIGHLAEQVQRLLGDGGAFGLAVRYVRQPQADGSADAVRRAGEEPPYLVLAADTLFPAGDIASFARARAVGRRDRRPAPAGTRSRCASARAWSSASSIRTGQGRSPARRSGPSAAARARAPLPGQPPVRARERVSSGDRRGRADRGGRDRRRRAT